MPNFLAFITKSFKASTNGWFSAHNACVSDLAFCFGHTSKASLKTSSSKTSPVSSFTFFSTFIHAKTCEPASPKLSGQDNFSSLQIRMNSFANTAPCTPLSASFCNFSVGTFELTLFFFSSSFFFFSSSVNGGFSIKYSSYVRHFGLSNSFSFFEKLHRTKHMDSVSYVPGQCTSPLPNFSLSLDT